MIIPVSPDTVTVLGSAVTVDALVWRGLRFAEAWVRENSTISGIPDIHLAVPWCHPEDEPTKTEDCGIYRVHPRFGLGSVVRIGGDPKMEAPHRNTVRAVVRSIGFERDAAEASGWRIVVGV